MTSLPIYQECVYPVKTRLVQEVLKKGPIDFGQAWGVLHTIEYMGSLDTKAVGGASCHYIKNITTFFPEGSHTNLTTLVIGRPSFVNMPLVYMSTNSSNQQVNVHTFGGQ